MNSAGNASVRYRKTSRHRRPRLRRPEIIRRRCTKQWIFFKGGASLASRSSVRSLQVIQSGTER